MPREAPAGAVGILSPRMLRMASDARLVGWVREGRAAAFEALYDRHHKAILSFCHHMLGSMEEAEDAVQHTFLAAYNGLAASERPIHLRAWLFTIARNRCYSILRRRREHPLEEVAEPATEGLATLVQRRQDLRDLVLDMRRLPDNQRAALVLAEMDALSHEQIGAVLGVPTPKVKALVFQARESLLASRSAREADCAEIREQLASLRGGALRRTQLRRHLRDCSGCREFRQQVDRQRRQLRLLMPVAPTIALKQTLLSGGGATAGGIAGGGLLASSTLKGASLVGALAAAVGAAGTIVAVHGVPRVWQGHQAPRHVVAALAPGKATAPALASAGSPPATAPGRAGGVGRSSAATAQAFAALAFSRSHQLVAQLGHAKGSSSRLLVTSAKAPGSSAAGAQSAGSVSSASPASSPAGPSASQQRLLSSVLSSPSGRQGFSGHTLSTQPTASRSAGSFPSAPSSASSSYSSSGWLGSAQQPASSSAGASGGHDFSGARSSRSPAGHRWPATVAGGATGEHQSQASSSGYPAQGAGQSPRSASAQFSGGHEHGWQPGSGSRSPGAGGGQSGGWHHHH